MSKDLSVGPRVAQLDNGGLLTQGREAVRESVPGETQIERTVLRDQSHQPNLADLRRHRLPTGSPVPSTAPWLHHRASAPLSEHRIVVVEVGQLQSQLEFRSCQEPQKSGQCWLTTT